MTKTLREAIAEKSTPASLVAFTLAVGVAVALNVLTFAAVYEAIETKSVISENLTQILTGWGGGMLGVLGAFVGYQFGKAANGEPKPPDPPKRPDPPRPPDPPKAPEPPKSPAGQQ